MPITDAEHDAKMQYDAAKHMHRQLKGAIERGHYTQGEQLKMLDQLWRHVQDFIPKHWREEHDG